MLTNVTPSSAAGRCREVAKSRVEYNNQSRRSSARPQMLLRPIYVFRSNDFGEIPAAFKPRHNDMRGSKAATPLLPGLMLLRSFKEEIHLYDIERRWAFKRSHDDPIVPPALS